MGVFGGIEAGGTKFVCAVGDGSVVQEKIIFPTTSPTDTIQQAMDFFDQYDIDSLGIGSFGPIDLNPNSATYGYITKTPKNNCSQTDVVGPFKERYKVPIAWTTDVNAAAAGELKAGAAKNNQSCLYLTVGTGIGGGAVLKNGLLEGYGHPEMGHLLVRRHPEDDFEGTCPFHGDCLEGMAAGPALQARYGKSGKELANEPKVWEIEAYYLAQALISFTLILSPEKIILGGGVMNQTHLLPMVRNTFKELLADYIPVPPLEEYIVSPGLGDDAGIIGSLLLAKDAKEQTLSK